MVTAELPTGVELRDLFSRTRSVVPLLNLIKRDGNVHVVECARLIMDTFHLELGDVKAIGGWWPGMHEAFSDARIDELIVPAIEAARPEWDKY